jgi:hypothetical protein
MKLLIRLLKAKELVLGRDHHDVFTDSPHTEKQIFMTVLTADMAIQNVIGDSFAVPQVLFIMAGSWLGR